MPKSFQSLRSQTSKDDEAPTEKIKSAGVNAPLPTDDNELDDADENTRNADGSAEDMVDKSFKPVYKKRADGSYTHIVSEEAIQEEQSLIENVLDNLKKIVTQHQASAIKLKDGTKVKVDATTANMILSVYGALNKNNQVKMAQVISKDKAGFSKMSSFAFKQGRITSKMGLQGPSAKAI